MYRLKADLTFEELDTLLACVNDARQKLVEIKLECANSMDRVDKERYIRNLDVHIRFLDKMKSKLMYVKI